MRHYSRALLPLCVNLAAGHVAMSSRFPAWIPPSSFAVTNTGRGHLTATSVLGARGLSSMSSSPRKRKVSAGKRDSQPPLSSTPKVMDSTPRHLTLTDAFLDENLAFKLRNLFDKRFENPRSTESERFVWDYWHVPNQYTLVRTSAAEFFGPELYGQLCDALTEFGQKNLGCNSITQPWLSFYVDGHEQRMHTDSWHGPFAYVLSLTPWDDREFTGGETFILAPKVLDYWRDLDVSVGLEEKTLMQEVEPRFNRLTVFDPRFPHGVRQVRGTHDPRKARLVLHGWFTDLGTPFYVGGLSEEDATGPLNEALEPLYAELSESSRATGVLNVRLSVRGSDGAITSVSAVADTLVPDPNDLVEGQSAEEARKSILAVIDASMKTVKFPAAANGQDTFITLPFVFE